MYGAMIHLTMFFTPFERVVALERIGVKCTPPFLVFRRMIPSNSSVDTPYRPPLYRPDHIVPVSWIPPIFPLFLSRVDSSVSFRSIRLVDLDLSRQS